MKSIPHKCIDGFVEDVSEKVECGFNYCPWCGEKYVTDNKKGERMENEKIPGHAQVLTFNDTIEYIQDLNSEIARLTSDRNKNMVAIGLKPPVVHYEPTGNQNKFMIANCIALSVNIILLVATIILLKFW